MTDFEGYMRGHQVAWLRNLKSAVSFDSDDGRLGYIARRKDLAFNFYPPVYRMLFEAPSARFRRLVREQDSRLFNTLSHWVHLANMYLPFAGWIGLRLFGLFLKTHTLPGISWISNMSIGYIERERQYHPVRLLGEQGHYGGRYLTVPDLGIRFVNADGRGGLLILKSKFVDTGFGPCPGYTDNEPGLAVNPDKSRCLLTGRLIEGKFSGCHLIEQGKRHPEYLLDQVDIGLYASLPRCPMSDCMSDLFRQQALARALEKKYVISVSGAMIDSRNEELLNCGAADGLGQLPDGWRRLFPRLEFVWLRHDDWYAFVKENDADGHWGAWLDYMGERYLYQ